LTFTPPGFKQSLNVKFPDSRLAVCEKCKKNFKTRDMCRVRNTHTTAPWTTAYICLTLDDSCLDENGKYVDKPLTVRMVQWQPFCVKDPFDPKTPVCAACKRTNRTRSFCRERHKHRQLPWCTVYVLLSALETADPSTVVAGPSKPVDEEASSKKEDNEVLASVGAELKTEPLSPNPAQDENSASGSKTSESLDGISENIKPEEGKTGSGEGEDGDDINDVAESRTFLAKVCCKSTTVHWLDLAEYEGNEGGNVSTGHPESPYMPPGAPGMPVQPVDPNQAHYYQHPMGYQQHQNSMKNHQQYFFQMQQRHQNPYAAQQAAWQAHYSHAPHMGMHGQPPPPPAQGPVPPAEGSPPPAPVTAGEAAAQQQKRNRQMEEMNGQSPPPPPPPPPPHHHHHPHHAPHPGQPPHGHGHQQQWMLYQQMYQAQLPPMSQPAPYPPSARPPPQEGVQQGMHGVMMPNDQQYNTPETPEENGKAHESETKRQRLV
jgi:hypothetical protein